MSELRPRYDPADPPEFPRGFRDYEPVQPRGTDWRALGRRLWAPIAAIGAFLAKFGVVLLKFKFLFSMIVSAAVYVWIGGWWFGIGLVLLLLVHEMGHVLEAKHQGLPVTAPMFIPFLGALINLKQMPNDAWREAKLALAGPLLGSLGAAVVYSIGAAEHSRQLEAIAFLGFFINLFNLIPASPLDGGRIVSALHPALWFVGVLALLGLVIYRPNPILILILLVAASEVWRRWRTRHHPQYERYYRVAPRRRLLIALLYFGLAAALVFGMHATHVPRSF
ncbi:MAG TPA: site-2 protease family protein [Gaiellaceae bacterium]